MNKQEMNRILDMALSADWEMQKLAETIFLEKMDRNNYRLLKEIGMDRGIHPHTRVVKTQASRMFHILLHKMSIHKKTVK